MSDFDPQQAVASMALQNSLVSALTQVGVAFAYAVARTHPNPKELLRAFENEIPPVLNSLDLAGDHPAVLAGSDVGRKVIEKIRATLRERIAAAQKN